MGKHDIPQKNGAHRFPFLALDAKKKIKVKKVNIKTLAIHSYGTMVLKLPQRLGCSVRENGDLGAQHSHTESL